MYVPNINKYVNVLNCTETLNIDFKLSYKKLN